MKPKRSKPHLTKPVPTTAHGPDRKMSHSIPPAKNALAAMTHPHKNLGRYLHRPKKK